MMISPDATLLPVTTHWASRHALSLPYTLLVGARLGRHRRPLFLMKIPRFGEVL